MLDGTLWKITHEFAIVGVFFVLCSSLCPLFNQL